MPGPSYIAAYPIDAPDPRELAAADVAAHPETLAAVSAAAGRAMDGAKLYAYLTTQAGKRASDGIRSLAGLEAKADALGARFVAWFQRLFTQPIQQPAWVHDRLEYQFACAAAEGAERQKVLAAEEYFHGRIEWYNFDVDRERVHFGDGMPLDAPVGRTLSMVPTPVTFGGMPNTRWWTFEDGRTNFGEVRPDTTDLAKLLLIEFGLVYANDWHIIPCTVPSGAIATVRGVAVTNVFGERTWIEAAGAGDDEDWQRWAMFLLSVKGHAHEPADLSLLIPPAAHKILDGPPIEDVVLARDEMANMVWGIERHVPLVTGESKPGREAADEMRRFIEQMLERRLGHPPQPPPAAGEARVRYQVMTSVPENWIPFIPVHVPGDNREIQLQRASMPRVIEGDPDPPIAVRPRTSLLRPGLDRTPGSPYFRARGGSAARGRARVATLPPDTMARWPRMGVARRRQTDRPRRRLERPRVRSIGGAASLIEHHSTHCESNIATRSPTLPLRRQPGEGVGRARVTLEDDAIPGSDTWRAIRDWRGSRALEITPRDGHP